MYKNIGYYYVTIRKTTSIHICPKRVLLAEVEALKDRGSGRHQGTTGLR